MRDGHARRKLIPRAHRHSLAAEVAGVFLRRR
jgi:hypothetical protein